MESSNQTAFEPKYPAFWVRFAACLIDMVILAIPFVLLLIGVPFATALITDQNTVSTIGLLSLSAALLLHPVYGGLFEASKFQATPGKMIFKIKVTDINGQRCSVARSLARRLSFLFSQLALLIGFLMLAWTKKKQCLHDIMANCLVIKA